MPIVSGDIEVRLTVKTGSAGDSTAGTPAGSLGKYVSTTQLSGTPLNNLFDDMPGSENAASTVRYRCVAVVNTHPTLTLIDPVVYLQGGDPAGGAVVTIAVDPTAASEVDASTAQGLEAATDTAPGGSVTGLAYSSPGSAGSGLALGDLGPGHARLVWIRRAGNNSLAADETITLAVTGETLA